jgi:F0F1-type ATP synthase membrane subunit c/vacuolar-type H+-ATPase subunit K
VTVIGGAVLLVGRSGVDLVQALFGLLSVGGALGFIGYARAHSGARNPDGHNVAATLLFLTAGLVAALVVMGFALSLVLDAWRDPWRDWERIAAPTLFAIANLVWAVSGLAWMQRLCRRYAEMTGRAFDGLPATLVFVAIALATGAALMTTTL